MVCGRTVAASVAASEPRIVRAAPVPRILAAAPNPAPIRDLVSAHLGVLRDRGGLLTGIEALLPLARGNGTSADPALVALMIAVAALDRRESRGGHYRTDWPEADPWQARSRKLTLADALAMAYYATTRGAA